MGLNGYLIVSTLLFAIGAFGFMARRNSILMLICIELMLNAVNLSLVAFNAYQPAGQAASNGAIFALMVMAVAAAEATVGLALVIAIIRTRQTAEVDEYSDLKE
jgi:NADH-quinone oxidoreductase subunit K